MAASCLRTVCRRTSTSWPSAFRRHFSEWAQVAGRGAAPPRSSHTVTAVGGRVAVFGGEHKPRHPFDVRVHLVDAEGSWESSTEAAPMPCPLLGHGAAAVGRRLYFFGGRFGETPDSAADTESNVLLSFDTGSGEWKLPEPETGDIPNPRSFIGMTAIGERLFVFGGCGTQGRLNDLWSYDTVSGSWKCLSAGGDSCPKPRGGSALLGFPAANGEPERLVLLYGFSGQQLSDVHVFDLEKGHWSDVSAEQSGQLPGSRSVFASAPLSSEHGHRLFLFGGELEESALGHEGAGKFAGDSFVLDVGSMAWKQLPVTSKDGPKARGWAGCAVVDGWGATEAAVLFGGLDADNVRLGDTWKLPLSG
eukprot:gnl/TRDRNA2_/TRDRNA2_147860_c0_seq1.p1 gnl/TRDRNA2_/TRDRNA2_147860_c0~~gnl/TRDRNA2_/TRDRNA2_147860_c0_seq1.p1  ORF type:complete len:362 (-),score=58.86 gnl/TRDRNA2_/TRDRNA2_147860_c0_seq1:43-1128(-)